MVPISQKIIGCIFSDKLNALKTIIESNNKEANLDGLSSKFILEKQIRMDSVQIKEITSNLRSEARQGNFLTLSKIGYSLYIGKYPNNIRQDFIDLYISGLKKLKNTNVFPPDRISFVYYHRDFLGIVLGTQFLPEECKKEYVDWLTEIADKRLNDPQINQLQKVLYQLIYSFLSSNICTIAVTTINILSLTEICVFYWGFKKGHFKLNDLSVMQEFQQRILASFSEEKAIGDEWLNSIIYFATKSCLTESINQVVISKDNVVSMLSNFESCLKRWPNKKNHKWVVKNEKDIQSILWVILRSIFDDVTEEDPSSKFGHRFSIVDFRIPSLSLLIEAKFIRKVTEFSKIENEIKIDTNDYLMTKPNDRIIVFIYDNSASVEEHQTTIHALEKIKGIHKVIIVSKPSHISSV